MKKIPTIFKRNPENMRELLNEPHPDCGWVFIGEGVATRKYDGTCVKIENGQYFKRREVKRDKQIPIGFIEEQFDTNTGKRVGWVPVGPDAKDNWHMEAFNNFQNPIDGTYELVGPKIQGNPEGYGCHALIKHSEAEVFESVPRTIKGVADFMSSRNIEGIVFHHPDGRMGKIKKRDFGLMRQP